LADVVQESGASACMVAIARGSKPGEMAIVDPQKSE
jgi:hypothetical protein